VGFTVYKHLFKKCG